MFDIKKISKLSYLKLTDEETHSMKQDLNEVIGFFDKLKGAKTDLKELKDYAEGENLFRHDEVQSQKKMTEGLLENDKVEEGYFKVPPVLKGKA